MRTLEYLGALVSIKDQEEQIQDYNISSPEVNSKFLMLELQFLLCMQSINK